MTLENYLYILSWNNSLSEQEPLYRLILIKILLF